MLGVAAAALTQGLGASTPRRHGGLASAQGRGGTDAGVGRACYRGADAACGGIDTPHRARGIDAV